MFTVGKILLLKIAIVIIVVDFDQFSLYLFIVKIHLYDVMIIYDRLSL